MRLGLGKALGAAGVLIITALVGGTLIGSALAGEETDTGGGALDAGAGQYCDVFMDSLASELGTTRDGLVAAGQAAANAAIDAAVASGDLTEERATRLRERVADYDGEGCGWFGPGGRERHGHGRGGGGFGRGFAHGFLGANTVDTAAEALGLSEAEAISALREHGSLQAVAEAQGVDYATLTATILASMQAELDAAVAEGTIPQGRADSILERLTTWLNEGGEMRGPGRDRGPSGDDD